MLERCGIAMMCLLLIPAVICFASPTRIEPVDQGQVKIVIVRDAGGTLVNKVNEMRASRGLQSLDLDIVRSHALEKYLPKTKKPRLACAYPLSANEIDWFVPEQRKSNFQCYASDLADLIAHLAASDTFRLAVMDTEYNAIAVGVGKDQSDDIRAVVSLIGRYLDLDPITVVDTYGGSTALTMSGEAPDISSLRFVLYPTLPGPRFPRPEKTWEREVDVGQSNRFEETMPVSLFGRGICNIAIYVKPKSSDQFVISNLHRFIVE
jgi:hypothetical protein